LTVVICEREQGTEASIQTIGSFQIGKLQSIESPQQKNKRTNKNENKNHSLQTNAQPNEMSHDEEQGNASDESIVDDQPTPKRILRFTL
jgi:hypothetical protein